MRKLLFLLNAALVLALAASLPVLWTSSSPAKLLVFLSAYLPFVWAFALAVTLASSVLCRWGKAGTVLVLVALAFPVAIYGPRMIPRLSPPRPQAVRVATWNVGGWRFGVSAAQETIGRLGADLLALQEVVAEPGDTGEADPLAKVLSPMGYTWAFVPYSPGAAYNSVGIALATRPPLRLLWAERRTYVEGGRWPYVLAEVEVDGAPWHVVVPHLRPFAFGSIPWLSSPSWRVRLKGLAVRVVGATRWHLYESTHLLNLVDGLEGPVILLGDFNSAPDHPVHWKLRRRMVDCLLAAGKPFASTYTFFLPVRIDYIYVRYPLEVHAAEVSPTNASDHKPVVALVSVNPGRTKTTRR